MCGQQLGVCSDGFRWGCSWDAAAPPGRALHWLGMNPLWVKGKQVSSQPHHRLIPWHHHKQTFCQAVLYTMSVMGQTTIHSIETDPDRCVVWGTLGRTGYRVERVVLLLSFFAPPFLSLCPGELTPRDCLTLTLILWFLVDLGQWEATAGDQRVEGQSWGISSPVLAVMVYYDSRPGFPSSRALAFIGSRTHSAPSSLKVKTVFHACLSLDVSTPPFP